jgi:hypothetical protein
LKLRLRRGEVNPALDGDGVQVVRIRIKNLLYHLARALELAGVPQESGGLEEVSVASHLFLVLNHGAEGVNCFFVNIPAPLVIVN